MVSGFGAAGLIAALGMDGASVGGPSTGGGVTTGAAVGSDPVADFARAAGVLSSPFVETITGAGAVAVFAALAAGARATGFFGGAGLKESRIFSAATASCERMWGI